jgi:hypothetical protein
VRSTFAVLKRLLLRNEVELLWKTYDPLHRILQRRNLPRHAVSPRNAPDLTLRYWSDVDFDPVSAIRHIGLARHGCLRRQRAYRCAHRVCLPNAHQGEVLKEKSAKRRIGTTSDIQPQDEAARSFLTAGYRGTRVDYSGLFVFDSLHGLELPSPTASPRGRTGLQPPERIRAISR